MGRDEQLRVLAHCHHSQKIEALPWQSTSAWCWANEQRRAKQKTENRNKVPNRECVSFGLDSDLRMQTM